MGAVGRITHSPFSSALPVPITWPLLITLTSLPGAARPATTIDPFGSMRTTSNVGCEVAAWEVVFSLGGEDGVAPAAAEAPDGWLLAPASAAVAGTLLEDAPPEPSAMVAVPGAAVVPPAPVGGCDSAG